MIGIDPALQEAASADIQKEKAIKQGELLASEGADLLDVGGESTRPFSDSVPVEEELRRVIPVVSELAKRTSIPISIDTCKAEVARAALDAGATISSALAVWKKPWVRTRIIKMGEQRLMDIHGFRFMVKIELIRRALHVAGPKSPQSNHFSSFSS